MDTKELCGTRTARGFNQTTAHGRAFYSLDPRPEEVFIDDIAAQLSRICRFGGALKEYREVSDGRIFSLYGVRTMTEEAVETYSVAQHSVLVADHVPEPFRLRALLHDAAEAYVGDIIKPIKEALTPNEEAFIVAAHASGFGRREAQYLYRGVVGVLPDFSRIECRVLEAIYTRFGLPLVDEESDAAIKIADYEAVLTEHRDLQIDNGAVDWGVPTRSPWPERIIPLLPSAAREQFLQRFNELYKGE